MKPEKQQLIDDLLAGDERREITLRTGAKILRRRRHWHVAERLFTFMTLATAIFFLAEPGQSPPGARPDSIQAQSPAPFHPRLLTDQELLALFPNTPVALATLSNGRKTLIFPRPGDEAKFVTHL